MHERVDRFAKEEIDTPLPPEKSRQIAPLRKSAHRETTTSMFGREHLPRERESSAR